MRLTDGAIPASAWTAIEVQTAEVLSARLDPGSIAPVAVALSGGGDSVALLIAARLWAHRAGRSVIALTVDHGLSSHSACWTQECAERARALGAAHRALVWSDDKPSSGLAAAARTARHRLLADAAREAGASVILMGHTADDRLEARVMRAEGCSVSEPRQWSPSPAWPEGRGVFVLRPLIDIRRAAIRDGLRERGESWIDDPANLDQASARARARRCIADGGEAAPAMEAAGAVALFRAATVDRTGAITVPIETLRNAPPSSRGRFLGAAVVCAGGRATPPRRAALDRLWDRLATEPRVAATLAGARIEGDGETLGIMRDAGALETSPVLRRVGAVIDGRYEIDGAADDTHFFALGGHMARLDRREREALSSLPPAARRSLPAMRRGDGSVTSPLIDRPGRPRARSLVGERLAAACGAIAREVSIGFVGETASGVLDMSASIERPVHEPA